MHEFVEGMREILARLTDGKSEEIPPFEPRTLWVTLMPSGELGCLLYSEEDKDEHIKKEAAMGRKPYGRFVKVRLTEVQD